MVAGVLQASRSAHLEEFPHHQREVSRKSGGPPSSVEIQRRFNLGTNAAAQQTIWALEHKGYIATTFGVKRSIRLIEAATPKPK